MNDFQRQLAAAGLGVDVNDGGGSGPDPFQQQMARAGGLGGSVVATPVPLPGPSLQGQLAAAGLRVDTTGGASIGADPFQQQLAQAGGLVPAAARGAPVDYKQASNAVIAAGGSPADLDRYSRMHPGEVGSPFDARVPVTAVPTPPAPGGPAPVSPIAPKPATPAPAPQPRPAAGGGDGGISKLTKKVEQDQAAVQGTYDKEKADQQALADATAAKDRELADRSMQVNAENQIMIARQYERDQDAASRMQAWRDQSMKLSEDLRAQKIDPNRYMANQSTGAKIGMITGGILGGILAAWQGGENQFLKTINGEIDKDIRAQQEQYERGKDFLKQRDSVYAQMVQATGDQRLAAMQVRQSLLESAKMDLEAQAKKLGIPEVQARAKIAIDAIDREQKNLGMQWDQHALQAARAQAAAAQAARLARERELFERGVTVTKLGQDQQRIDIDAQKAGADKKLTDEQKVQIASDEFNSQVKDIKKSGLLDELGYGLGARAAFGQRLAPEATQITQRLTTVNTQMLQAIGKVAKDADGKPNEAMINELKQRFEIHPTDTPAVAMAKLEGVQSAVNALARQQGANAPKPGTNPDLPATVQMKK